MLTHFFARQKLKRLFGLFGSDNQVNFTFTFPHFDRALAALGLLEFGRTQQLLP
jgi:hypothetical protein